MHAFARIAPALLICAALTGTVPANAQESDAPSEAAEDAAPREPQLCPICLAANDHDASYTQNAGSTLVRGVLNFGFGWTELLMQPATEAKGGGNVFTGLGSGLNRGLWRTVNGLGEIATFWMPKVQGEYIHFSKDCPLDTDGK
ncbi:MAG TPA: hypothetical protein VF981_08565 [Gemmatimonadaceae bacterium]